MCCQMLWTFICSRIGACTISSRCSLLGVGRTRSLPGANHAELATLFGLDLGEPCVVRTWVAALADNGHTHALVDTVLVYDGAANHNRVQRTEVQDDRGHHAAAIIFDQLVGPSPRAEPHDSHVAETWHEAAFHACEVSVRPFGHVASFRVLCGCYAHGEPYVNDRGRPHK